MYIYIEFVIISTKMFDLFTSYAIIKTRKKYDTISITNKTNDLKLLNF